MTTVRKGKIRAVDTKSRQASVTGAADQGGGIEGDMDIDVDIVDVSLVRIVGEMGNACSKRCFFLYIGTGVRYLMSWGMGGMPHIGNRAGQMGGE